MSDTRTPEKGVNIGQPGPEFGGPTKGELPSKERTRRGHIMVLREILHHGTVETGAWEAAIRYAIHKLELQSPDETSGWQPIETAPDPQITPVLGAVLREAGDYAVGEMHQTEVGWYWAGNDPSDSWGGQIYPAYWQPLPKPPGSAVKADGSP